MFVYVLFKNNKFIGVYRSYEAAEEAIGYQYFDSRFPAEYEIVKCKVQ